MRDISRFEAFCWGVVVGLVFAVCAIATIRIPGVTM